MFIMNQVHINDKKNLDNVGKVCIQIIWPSVNISN